jgi:uncharacterized protein YndB with AHSA1/START domain
VSDTDLESAALRLERSFDAPAEDVFDAWTNPEVLRRWWCAGTDWRTPVAEVDLRVGGGYRLSMEDPEASARYTVRGEYIEVRRPQRLVYSWSWEDSGGQPGHVSTVAVDFLGDGQRTTVVVEHSGLESADSREKHRVGWEGCLENLKARMFTQAGQRI